MVAWRALETAYDSGKIRALGVANFEQEDLDNILTNGLIKPVVNQILLHISNTPLKLLHYCEKQHLLVEAYSPIAHGQILQNQAIKQLAAKYHVSVSQLAIRYCLELGTLPLPKSENPPHIFENSQVDFQISPEDLIKNKGRNLLILIRQMNAYYSYVIINVIHSKEVQAT